MSAETFLWYDFETFGTDPRFDRPAQVALRRTDSDLRPVAEPSVAWCVPPDDYLPDPGACLVTGITPAEARRLGVPEPRFAALLHELMTVPGTCTAGYNNLRFDDEFTRNLFYRNFFDPYEREWRNGNSRWDLIDVVRLCHALRPDGIDWPEHEPGRPSFRLEDLSAANRLTHEQAHDALSDVDATIALARLLRRRQPRLYDWALGLRDKARVRSLLDPAARAPLLHVSSRYPATRSCLAVVAPLCTHPQNDNATVVADLAVDPASWMDLPAGELSRRLFATANEVTGDLPRPPIKLVHANRSPMLAPLPVLREPDRERLGIDLDRQLAHLEVLRDARGLNERLREVYQAPPPAVEDVEGRLYDGFIPDSDRALMPAIRSAPPERLAGFAERLSDPRLVELLFRYRARHHPDSLSGPERRRWREHRRRRLVLGDGDRPAALRVLEQRLQALRDGPAGSGKADLLDAIERDARGVCAGLDAPVE